MLGQHNVSRLYAGFEYWLTVIFVSLLRISYDTQFCQVVNTIPAHDDAVSCMAYLAPLGFLVTGSWDGCIKLWKGFTRSHARSFRLGDSILAYFNGDEKVISLDAKLHTVCGKINIVMGTEEGSVCVWSIDQTHLPMEEGTDQGAANVLKLTKEKRFSSIRRVLFNHNGTKIACCDSAGHLVVYFVHDVARIDRNCDSVVILFERKLNIQVTCMDWSFGPNRLVLADSKGLFYVWDMVMGKVDQELTLHKGAITAICYLDERRFITAGEDAQRVCIKVWKCDD